MCKHLDNVSYLLLVHQSKRVNLKKNPSKTEKDFFLGSSEALFDRMNFATIILSENSSKLITIELIPNTEWNSSLKSYRLMKMNSWKWIVNSITKSTWLIKYIKLRLFKKISIWKKIFKTGFKIKQTFKRGKKILMQINKKEF